MASVFWFCLFEWTPYFKIAISQKGLNGISKFFVFCIIFNLYFHNLSCSTLYQFTRVWSRLWAPVILRPNFPACLSRDDTYCTAWLHLVLATQKKFIILWLLVFVWVAQNENSWLAFFKWNNEVLRVIFFCFNPLQCRSFKV